MIAKLFAQLKIGVPLISDRAYAARAPQNVSTPYIVYFLMNAGRDYTHEGFSNLSRDRVQVSVYDTTYAGARAVAKQVVAALESWGDVSAAFQANQMDMYENDTGLYHIPIDYIVWHKI